MSALDITLGCSLGLEGGIMKYRDILKPMPQGSMYMLKDWNRALIEVARKPQFKKRFGALGKFMLAVQSPAAIAAIIDKIVPYRSFYYAKRFTEAYHSVKALPNVVDFGRGFSPLVHFLDEYKSFFINTFSIEKDDTTNEIFQQTSQKLGINKNHKIVVWDKIDSIAKTSNFISLGTFVYIPKDEQFQKLRYVAKKFSGFYIELEPDQNTQQADNKFVSKMGAEYKPGLTKHDILNIFQQQGTGLHAKAISEGTDLYDREFPKLMKALAKSTEYFISK
ncbi:MAG: hypothetical protein FWD33_01315 [Alphaproteobacteria bacterium]|nr:hypothetical protein [Alphaproteobacteria bacterium]